ncbi:MAG: SDR family oxidoreductase [Dehalococcoidales bacterium]|nr:SDR family oxidoreductase [Dehalococcoidales bacterium]
MRFENRVAVITGAGAGMARSAAVAFAGEGAHVFINDIDEAELENTAREVRSAGGRVTAIAGDAAKSECVQNVVGKALEQYGRIDILFNYVGGIPAGISLKSFTEDSESVWDPVIELNLKPTLRFTRAVLGGMIQRKYGKIINTGSGAGRTGVAGMSLYSTSKGAVIAFTKAIAREVAPYSINVNCICPGPTATPTMLKGIEGRPELLKAYESTTPMKRLGRSEEVAAAVLFLASDEASFITGQALSVDGGQVMI